MQKHIIKRLIFSFHLHSATQGRQLEHDVINIYRKQVEQLLDEHFSKLSGPGVEYQIGKLELNLGRIKPENLRTEMPGRISEQLSKSLHHGPVPAANIISEREKQVSLFSHFVETGRLPWWTERLHKQTLEQLIEHLCVNSPTDVKGLMLHVIKDERKIRRLINQLPDQSLFVISGLYLPRNDAVLIARQYSDAAALFTELDRQKAAREIYTPMQLPADDINQGRVKLREHYWQNVLISLAYGPIEDLSSGQLLLDTLVSLTNNNRGAFRSLVTRLDHAAGLLKAGGHKFSARLPELIDKFAKETADMPEDAATISSSPASAAYTAPTDSVKQEIVSSPEKKPGPGRVLTETGRRKILQDPGAQERTKEQRNIIKDPFTDSSEDYIYNAGLVILWPYLPRLFLNLGMVNNDSFVNVDAAERAALLLQYLVEPDAEILESLLSLNKLLCGFELSWPLPADFTPTEREQGECHALLTAVTRHWGVLKNMSFERVRLDFFQRQGILRPRDGNWQLQVEQQTHDILMQKLPWPLGVVKLPWMDYTLFVQWG